jgi:hypothetical protein
MRIPRPLSLLPVLALLLAPGRAPALAAEAAWPKEFDTPLGTVSIYQPQPESLTGNVTEGRAAISLIPTGKTEPVFGAIWYDAQLNIDKDERVATVEAAHIRKMKVTGMSEAQVAELADALEAAINDMPLSVEIDAILTSLELDRTEKDGVKGLRNDPPKIITSIEPAVLILFDGEPVLREVEKTSVSQVINSPYTVLFDRAAGTFFTTDGVTWFEAGAATGPWAPGATPSREVQQLAERAEAERAKAEAGSGAAAAEAGDATYAVPKIYTSTSPAELIVFDGPPQWTPYARSDLLYARNTDSVVLQNIDQGLYYVLISGRWFRSKEFRGPWSFVRPDQLPATFQDIPAGESTAEVRAAIAGTDEALEALIDNFIPQTAAVDRSEAKLTVQYDGQPQFEQIPGTKVAYATNTGTSVLRIGSSYYAVDNAIWFVSSSPGGPWQVADEVPSEVDSIPPSSPVYNVRYVNVYYSTPQVVYVGYTPGYIGSYPYYGTVVYGTGWHYRPWIGPAYYYPRPYTWGFNVSYNPWTGWGFGMSWSAGFFNFSVGWGSAYRPYHPPCWGGGWWGPGGYRPPYYPGGGYWRGGYWGGGYRPGGNINIGNININNNINIGNNIYNRPQVRPYARPSARPGRGPGQTATRPATRPAGRPNDVLVDKNGNLVRPAPGGGGKWETLESNGQWKPTTRPDGRPATRPGTPGASVVERPATRPDSRPARPTTRPAPAPSTRPAPAPPPSTRPAPAPATRPAPTPASPSTRPATATPVPRPPQSRPTSPTLRGPSSTRDYSSARAKSASRPTTRPSSRPAARPAPRPTGRPAPGR